MFIDDWRGVARVLLISVAAYVGLIAVLRVAGKRSLAKLNAFDLVVTVALGSTLATVVLSKDIALVEGLLGFVALVTLQYVVAWLSVRWPWFQRLVRASPTLLVEDGRCLHGAMRAQRVTRGDVDAAVRAAGVGRLDEVAAVVLETDGSLSVIRKRGEGELDVLRSVRRVDEPSPP